MEQRNDLVKLLDLLPQPGFWVENNLLTRLNPAAQGLALEPGMDVRTMLATGREEYARFTNGCLYVQLNLGDSPRGAAVHAMEGGHAFVLDPEPENSQLTAYALAARALRSPMIGVLLAADQLGQSAERAGDDAAVEQAARLSRGLHQLMRTVNNMSDALLYTEMCRQELLNLTGVFEEIFEKARVMLAQAGLTLNYRGPGEAICAMADSQQLERAVLNLLSNAAMFSPAGGTIDASLTRRGSLLRLSITDHGEPIAEALLPGIFHRYLRTPCIEDSRFGIGLGMALIRAAAVNHGGTVLIDRPDGANRITMTMSLSQQPQSRLHSPTLNVDYAGGWDHTLMELSQVLPASVYERK